MPTPDQVKSTIIQTISDSVEAYVRRAANRNPKFQVLDLLIPEERKIRSIVGGLETSFGTKLWERLATELAINNGYEIIQRNLCSPTHMPSEVSSVLDNLLRLRISNRGTETATTCHDKIKEACQIFINAPIDSFIAAPTGFGVDLWFRKSGIDYFFDTKTVQPNRGAFSTLLKQILTWYSYYYSEFPTGNAEARIVFPYNPHDGPFWENATGGGLPLEPINEAWVGNEFWDPISGVTNTYGLICEGFVELRESGILRDLIRTLL